jgi:GNAT superfamily N-acetyltransferase
MDLAIAPADLLSAEAQRLIAALNAELAALYPEPGANHFRLDPDEVAPGRGVFLVARRDAVAVGCGAIRRVGDDAELKRMYVVPAARGRGVARAILWALEHEARRLGARRIVLETGTRQREALALYRRAGFTAIAPFGEYASSPLSLCLAKTII